MASVSFWPIADVRLGRPAARLLMSAFDPKRSFPCIENGAQAMDRVVLAVLLALLVLCQPARAQTLNQKAAVALAEQFVAENGYTSAKPDRIKQRLDFEAIERAKIRSEMLLQRHNTLQPKAIGAKVGGKGSSAGWSIAFAYSSQVRGSKDSCRVVTVDADGSNIRVEHVDGIRAYFSGFN